MCWDDIAFRREHVFAGPSEVGSSHGSPPGGRFVDGGRDGLGGERGESVGETCGNLPSKRLYGFERASVPKRPRPLVGGKVNARLAGYRRNPPADRAAARARPFGAADLAAVLATCHRPTTCAAAPWGPTRSPRPGRLDAVIREAACSASAPRSRSPTSVPVSIRSRSARVSAGVRTGVAPLVTTCFSGPAPTRPGSRAEVLQPGSASGRTRETSTSAQGIAASPAFTLR